MSQLTAPAMSMALASIWLGACLVVAVTLLLRELPELKARWRYRIWLMVLMATLTGPAIATMFMRVQPSFPLQAPPTVTEVDGSEETARDAAPSSTRRQNPPSPAIAPAASPTVRPQPISLDEGPVRSNRVELPRLVIALVGSLLLVGVAVSLLRIPFQLRELGRIKRRAVGPPDGLRQLWAEALNRLPSTRRLRILVSRDVPLPVACGYLRPAVLVPDGLSAALTDEETRHLLLHELAHLIRRDDWGLLGERVIRALCWWHPVVWWIGTRLEQQREEACDELVASGGERRSYARTLVHLAELSKARSNGLAPGALRGHLTRRVEALLSAPAGSGRRWAPRVPAMVLAGSVLVAGSRVSPPRVGALGPILDTRSAAVHPAAEIPIAALDSLFSSYADSGFSGTILLARRGEILLQKGYGLADRERGIPATADTRYSTAGMTKLFTATALLELAQDGKLTLQDSLSRWIESLSGEKGVVTLDQLLTYRDGLTRLNAPVQRDNPEEFVRALSLAPASFTPGTGYRYSDHGHSLLGLVIEKATGEGYESYIHRRFLQPAGLSRTGFENEGGPMAVEYSGPATALQPVGRRAYRWGRRASLGLVSTAGDLYRWFQELSDSTIVSPAVRDQLFRVRTRTDYNTDQAYGLELVDRGQGHRLWRRVAGTPGFEGELLHDPDNDWTAVILVNTRLGWRFRVWREIERVMWQPPSPDLSS